MSVGIEVISSVQRLPECDNMTSMVLKILDGNECHRSKKYVGGRLQSVI